MAKNDVRQLNYTVDEINEGLKNSLEIGLQYSENKDSVQLVTGTENKKVLGSIANPGAESGGLTLKYVDEKTLRIYNTNGSKNEEDWTPVGDEVLIISADPDAVSYKFDFTYVSTSEPQIFVKESVDKDIQNTQWQILYKIKQLDNKGNISYDPIEVVWKITSGNNSREFKETIKYGVDTLDAVYSFNWVDKIYKDTNFYKAGSYNVKATFYGLDGLKISRGWDFSLTSLTFSSNFSEEKIYRENPITIPYTVQGNMKKTISGKLINKSTLEEIDLGSIPHIASDFTQTGNFTTSGLTHGVYELQLQCVGVSGATDVFAPDVYKEFIFVEEGNNTPLIRWSYSENVALQQYKRTEFKYGVYNPSNTVTNIMIELFSENNNTKQSRTIVPNNDTYSWFYYPTQGGSIPQTFSITTQDLNPNISASKELLVKPFEGADKIMAIEGVSFDFNPVGRTNYDANRDEYVFNGKNYLIPSENFDWANGGWVQENIGTAKEPQIVDAFLIKAGSSITLDYSPFEAAESGGSKNDMTAKNGKNMKFIFKTTNCQKMTAPIMVCKGSEYAGLIINSQNAEIYNREKAESKINLPYVEEEIVELEYNIEAETHGRESLLVSYISSDPSQAVKCNLTPSGQSGQWTQDTPQKLVFGSEFCDVYLYRVKVYDRELSDAEIMQNYYADAFDGTTAYQRYSDNDILLENGDIDIEKLKQKYPELRILLIDCKDVWSNGKKDYREAYVEHYYPNGRLKDNWKANVGISIQGTSSVEYLTSAGNFDIDFKCKKIENPREKGLKYLFEGEFCSKEELVGNPNIEAALVEELLETEYAMTDDSIPVNYINVKVNVASSENANNACLAQWYHLRNGYKRRARLFNEKIRDTMEFHPCVIFLKENAGLDNREFDNDGNYHFYACGDFGNSKKNNNAFGMGEEAAYIVNELIANGEIDETQREEKIAEYQAKECIVEVSNNINDICRFKSAIFEEYQVYDEEKKEISKSKLWDGAAVEFRYCPDEDDTSIVKAETLKLWKWLYSVDAAAPGRNEVLISNVTRTEEEAEIVYTFKTPIPYTDDFVITSIAPNFLFDITDGTSVQYLEKYDIEKFVTDYLKESFENHCRFYHNEDGCYEVEIRLPKANLTYENFNGLTPKFFISFTSKYVLNWTSDSEFTVSEVEDTAAYRNNKFTTEYESYFEKRSLLYFYLFTERFTMIDNRAKNTFIHFDGLKWNYCFDYDNDTALGCNNRGYLTMDYGVEDIDNADGYPLTTHGGEPAFNAYDSVLWVNVRNNLYADLRDQYTKTALAWSSDSINNEFETYQNHKCNWLQMIDMRRKYLRPFTYGHGPSTKEKTYEEKYLPMLQGRKTLQRKRYQKYQGIYFETKYVSAENTSGNIFSFRAAYSDINFTIIPYIKCYPMNSWDDKRLFSQRTWAGEEQRIDRGYIQNDLNFTIYPANFISAVNGLNNSGVKSASMGNGIKLTSINLSDNPNLPDAAGNIEISKNQTLLTSLNLKNTGATQVPSLHELTNIRYINTENTNVTSIIFANGGLVEEAHLGAATEILSSVNNSSLTQLSIQQNTNNKYNLKEVTINNPSKAIDWIEIINTGMCPNLNKVSVVGIDYTTNDCWSFDDKEYLEHLHQLKENGATVSLGGKIYIKAIREHEYLKYLETWPGLQIDHDPFMPTYTVRFYKDQLEDGTLIPFDPPFEQIYDWGVVAQDPIKLGLMSTPVKEPDEHYTYTFIGWSHALSAFNRDTDIYATYSKTNRKYTVTWKIKRPSEQNPYIFTATDLVYGQDVVLEDLPNAAEIFECLATPDRVQTAQGPIYYLFSHWDQQTSYLTDDMVVNAVFESAKFPTVYNPEDLDTIDWTATQWYAAMESEPTTCNQFVLLGNRAKISFKQPDLLNATYTELVEKPIRFDGSSYINTGEKLANEDWTLIIDSYCIEGTVLSALTRGGQGLMINAGNTSTLPSWNGEVPSFSLTTNKNLNSEGHRNILIVSHKKDDHSLYVTAGNISDLSEVHGVIPGTQMVGDDRPLVLGAARTISGYSDYAVGAIYSCRLYKQFLGQSYRTQLARWINEDMIFDLTAHRSYGYDTEWNSVVQFNFTAAQSIFMPLAYSKQATGRAVNSELYQWLEQRLYAAMPNPWKLILGTPQVNHLVANQTDTINTSEDKPQHLWLPSFNELEGNSKESAAVAARNKYKTEFNANSIYTTNFSRVKYYGKAQKGADLVIDPADYEGAIIPLSYEPVNRLDGSPLQEGDIWNANSSTSATSTKWHIYYNNEWSIDSDYEYWMRGTIATGGNFGNFYNNSGSNGTHTMSGTNLKPVIPCFAIGRVTPDN